MSAFIAGAVISILSLILGFVANILYENRREKKKIRNESLRNHFQRLEVDAIKPISDIICRVTNSRGTLWARGEDSFYSLGYNWPTKDFEMGEFSNFKLHFPNQADAVTKLINKVDKHNEDCRSFIGELKELIEEKTHVPVVEGKQPPFLSANVPVYVGDTLYKLALKKLSGKETANLEYDFSKARIDKKPDFWQLRTDVTVYGHLSTEEQASLCKQSLIELTDSAPLIEKMRDIYSEAQWLESGARGLARILDFTCDQHDKYGKLLKRKKACPVCQVIFE